MTEKLYYADSHLQSFTARVLSCDPVSDGWDVVLDKTAFFPEGGGQLSDVGTLDASAVTDVQERDGVIYHRVNAPLASGQTVTGQLDWQTRFRRMQVHSGEHIVSGLAHDLYGCTNVGFACGDGEATLDFDRELDWDQVVRLERLANGVIFGNAAIRTEFPEPAQLKQIHYRSKLDLKENVRLVIIEGCDVCACCAPHVSHTGEIGAIRLDGLMRHRGGVRLHLIAGWRAYEEARCNLDNVVRISTRLSVPREAVADAVERMMGELQNERLALTAKKRELTALRIASLKPTEGNLCLFEQEADMDAIRELVNAGMQLCGGACGVFSGSDEAGYRYIIGSRTMDLRTLCAAINAELSGRGGGSRTMIQGSCAASRARIEAYFADCLE